MKKKHYEPRTWGDKLAFWMVCFLRYPRDWYFRGRGVPYHLLLLETFAAIPGIVGGALVHLSCVRRIRDDKGWIQSLLDESQAERRHLMVMRELVAPSFLDKCIIYLVQFVFVFLFFLLYVFFQRGAHRFVGYLEEDAVEGYEEYIAYLSKHPQENTAIPDLAHTYWDFPKNAKLVDMMKVILEEEKKHRDVNHDFANQLSSKCNKRR